MEREFSPFESKEVISISSENRVRKIKAIVQESLLGIFLNNTELISLLCLPQNQIELAVGFIFTEGIIKDPREIESVNFNVEKNTVDVYTVDKGKLLSSIFYKRTITSGCGKGAIFFNASDTEKLKPNTSKIQFSYHQLLIAAIKFYSSSPIYRSTRGVHSSALWKDGELVVFMEDIGRHNTVDKIAGACVLKGISAADKVLFTTGRISSEMIMKSAVLGVPVVLSKAVPMSLALKQAERLGITVVNATKRDELIVYSHDYRII